MTSMLSARPIRSLRDWIFLLVQELRNPSSGLLGQGLRFGIAGGTAALVYVGTTTALSTVARLPFQAALIIGWCVGLIVHFTLQRYFVWKHATTFALALHHQLGRYLIAAAVQYGVTAASTSVLPSALGLSIEIVYLGTVAIIICTNFLVFRHGIFHAREPPLGQAESSW